MTRLVTLLLACCFIPSCTGVSFQNGTYISGFHTYTSRWDRQQHYVLQLRHGVSGLRAGPCGFGIGGWDWSYSMDLAGDGPRFRGQQIKLSDDEHRDLKVSTGEVDVDKASSTVKVALTIVSDGQVVQFAGNGTHRVKNEY